MFDKLVIQAKLVQRVLCSLGEKGVHCSGHCIKTRSKKGQLTGEYHAVYEVQVQFELDLSFLFLFSVSVHVFYCLP